MVETVGVVTELFNDEQGKNSTWNPMLGIAIGGFISVVLYHYNWSTDYLRNMTVGLVLSTLAIDLIPRISRLSRHNETNRTKKGDIFGIPVKKSTILSLLGILMGAILVYIFTREQEKYRQRRKISLITWETIVPLVSLLMIGGFLMGITFDLSTSANVVFSITLGTIFVGLLISWIEDFSDIRLKQTMSKLTIGIVVLIITILVIFSIVFGRYLGKKYVGTNWYYFFTAFAIGLLIWLLIARLLIGNLDIPREEVSSVASAVFIGFTIGWLLHV
jgi:hypothetical protein